jgi:Arm DNA-binding domain
MHNYMIVNPSGTAALQRNLCILGTPREPQNPANLPSKRRLPMQKRITSARQVETLRPSDKRQELRDGEVKGLILRITPAGDKSWSVLYSRQPDGKKRRVTIGPFSAVTLDQR